MIVNSVGLLDISSGTPSSIDVAAFSHAICSSSSVSAVPSMWPTICSLVRAPTTGSTPPATAACIRYSKFSGPAQIARRTRRGVVPGTEVDSASCGETAMRSRVIGTDSLCAGTASEPPNPDPGCALRHAAQYPANLAAMSTKTLIIGKLFVTHRQGGHAPCAAT
jgi:hypothetical protein